MRRLAALVVPALMAAIALGADHAINYASTDFVEEVKKITGGSGVHIVLDMVAGEYVARNLQCLAEDVRHVTIAVQAGDRAGLNMVARSLLEHETIDGATVERLVAMGRENSATPSESTPID